MESKSKRRPLQFNSQVLILLAVIVAVALGWWRTHDRLIQSQAQIDAIRHSQEIEASEPKDSSDSIRRHQPLNQIQTPEQFITSLREIEDWYEFADDTADPFAKTPVADDTISMLLDLLNDPDAEIRTRALATLGMIGRHPEIVVPAVTPLLNDENSNVRWHAAYTLGRFGDDALPGVPALTSQMNDDESPIATFATMMVGEIDPTMPIETRLVELMSNSIDQNRDRAIGALAKLRTPTALEALVRRYRNEKDPKLRDRLARAIANVDSRLNAVTAEPSDARETSASSVLKSESTPRSP